VKNAKLGVLIYTGGIVLIIHGILMFFQWAATVVFLLEAPENG
jgi:hypothetical protein